MNSLFNLFGSLLNKHGRYKIFGKTIKYNQLVQNTATLSLETAHKYFTKLSGVASIQTGISSLSVNSGDIVCDLTLLQDASTTLEQFYATDLGKEIQKGWYPPYSPTNTIYEADLSETTFVKPRLPEAYQEVEYIESNGSQYIDTNWIYKQNSTIEIKIARQELGDNIFFGNLKTDKMCGVGIDTGGKPYLCVSTLYRSIATNTDFDFHTFKAIFGTNGFILYYDNLLTRGNEISNNHETTCFLFAYRNNAGIKGTATKTNRISYCRIYENDILIRNFIPCYRKADNVIGMYDLVNGVFYTNKGTGTFIKGANHDTLVEGQTVSILQNGQPLYLSENDYYLNASGKTYRAETETIEQANSVMLRKGFTKCYDKNNLELELEIIDPLNFSNKIVQGKNSPTITAEKIITKGFTSGDEHFTQLYIYEDGEIWYVNSQGSAQAYANGVGWEIEYKTLKFDDKVSLTESERNALLNIYDLL